MTRPKISPTTKTAVAVWNDTTHEYEMWDGDITIAGNMIDVDYDYIAATYPLATTEVYTYKTGGATGTTVATITVVYTDATKDNISTITKT